MKVLLTLTAGQLGGMETFSSHLAQTFPDLKIIDYDQAKGGLLSRLPLRFATMPQKGMVISRHVLNSGLKPDVIFSSGLYGWYLGLQKPTAPVVNILHGVARTFAELAYHPRTFDYYRMKYVYALAEKISARNSVSVCNSTYTQRLVKEHYDVDSKVIYNAIDTKIFRPIEKAKARKALGWTKPTVIFVGPATRSKGFDVVQALAALHPEVSFVCISFHDAPPTLPNVRVLTGIGHDQLPLYYAAADACLFPSRFEGFGYVPLEALACGTPVVGNKTGIFMEYSPAGSILLTEPTIAEYSEALSHTLVKPYKPRSVYSDIKERFSLEKFSRSYRTLVSSL